MSESTSGVVAVFAFCSLLVALGVWLGDSPYGHDTFPCTNKCAGSHSIQYADKCYCEVKP